MNVRCPRFDAVVLAGDRGQGDPLLQRFGVPAKAFIEVGGRQMITRVVEALADSGRVRRIILCGSDPERFSSLKPLAQLMRRGMLFTLQAEKGPSLSAYKALKACGGEIPVLLTTCDHALLSKEHVDLFCRQACSKDADLVVALAKTEEVERRFPDARRTSYRFSDGRMCTCNLFAFMNTQAFSAARFWTEVEHRRKSPVKIIGRFGWLNAARYLLGRLSLNEAMEQASRVIGCRIAAVVAESPEMAIDVDSYEDWLLVQGILTGKRPLPS